MRLSQKDPSSCHHQPPFLCFHFLLLYWGNSGGGSRTSYWWSTTCWSRSTSHCVAKETPDVDIDQSLCKQTWPQMFNIYTHYFNEDIDLILCDHHLIILQDTGSRPPWCGWLLSEPCQVWCWLPQDEVRASPQYNFSFFRRVCVLPLTSLSILALFWLIFLLSWVIFWAFLHAWSFFF